MTTKSKKTETEPQPCQCRAVWAYNITKGDTPESLEDGDDPNEIVAVVHQSCGEQTSRTFAPGHDAKLKGVLLRAARSGREYSYTEGALLIHADPLVELANRGWSHLLVELKERPKKARKNQKPRKSDSPDSVTQVEAFNTADPFTSTVKVGRWTYPARIIQPDTGDGRVTVEYRKKDGQLVAGVVKPDAIVG
jgi:hypothetical protein